MTVLAQQGYGKAEKIEIGLREGSLSGAILSPRDMAPDALADFVQSLRSEFGTEPQLMMDPQFFATVIQDATDRNLPDYPYYTSGLRRSDFLVAKRVTEYVRNAIEYQSGLQLDMVASPSIVFDSFSDIANQTALQLGAESVASKELLQQDQELLVTFMLSEAALSDLDGINEFLDITTSWDVDGFYIIVEPQNQTYPASLDSDRLKNLMYMVYSWAELNDMYVMLGYSDFSGLPLRSVGASGQATGWFSGLRHFSRARWQPASGGRAPRPRYSAAPLLNSILNIPELSAAYQAGLIELCLSGTSHDSQFLSRNPADVDWSMQSQCLHHWEVMKDLSEKVVGDSVSSNVGLMAAAIDAARDSYDELARAGVEFDRLSGPSNLEIWRQSLGEFADMVQL